jgi:hypothetical protein
MMMRIDDDIRDQIKKLIAEGTPIQDIYVNECEEWGLSSAISWQDCSMQMDIWELEGDARDAAMGQLSPAKEWLKNNPSE